MLDAADYPNREIGQRVLAPADAVDRQVVAVNLTESALAAVGPGLCDVLWRVACEGEGLSDAERSLGWPARAAKLVLGLALDRLVLHYENQYGEIYLDNRHDPV